MFSRALRRHFFRLWYQGFTDFGQIYAREGLHRGRHLPDQSREFSADGVVSSEKHDLVRPGEGRSDLCGNLKQNQVHCTQFFCNETPEKIHENVFFLKL